MIHGDHMALSQNIQAPLKWDRFKHAAAFLQSLVLTVLMRTEAEIFTVRFDRVNLKYLLLNSGLKIKTLNLK